jgi:hypothetical protein
VRHGLASEQRRRRLVIIDADDRLNRLSTLRAAEPSGPSRFARDDHAFDLEILYATPPFVECVPSIKKEQRSRRVDFSSLRGGMANTSTRAADLT